MFFVEVVSEVGEDFVAGESVDFEAKLESSLERIEGRTVQLCVKFGECDKQE